MSTWFIAGIGTDVGKTYVSAQIIRGLRAAGRRVQALKPVASGVASPDAPDFTSSDTAVLLDALGLATTEQTVAACTPWRFAAPRSPDMAAAAEGRRLPFADILAWCRRRISEAGPETTTLVEGVGGIMSPFAEDALNLDVVVALGCPAVLVAGTYLGAISHTLTALEVLRSRGAPTLAVVLNESPGEAVDLDATAVTLRRFAPGVAIVPLRRGGVLESLPFGVG